LNTFKTHIISLKKDFERKSWMRNVMRQTLLEFEFIDALEPNDVSIDIKQQLFKNVDFFEWKINHDAVIATFLSHMSELIYAYENQQNLLILEDDIVYVRPFLFSNVNFEEFDLFNIGTEFGCYAYFVSWQGAGRILQHITSIEITQAYDWELFKIHHLRIKKVDQPVFIQTDKFKSNIAPNGYEKY